MPTSYTSLLGLALPVTGELSGVWGDTVNDYITNYLDGAVAGTQTISGNQTAVTLSKTTGSALTQAGSGATGSSQYSIINCTGNPASLLTITAPAASKPYIVINATSTSQQVKLVGSGPTTGVTLESGERAVVAWNGSDFVKIATSTADGVTTFSAGTTGFTPSTATSGAVTLAGTLATTNGGTGLTSFTANGVVYASSSSALTTGSALVFDGSNLGLGVTPSAWGSGRRALQMGTVPYVMGSGTSLEVLANSYYTGSNWIYNSNGAVSYYALNAGTHVWYNAPSGTAGNTVTFTQRLQITAAGFTQPTAYADTVVALGNTGTATTIDLQTANVFTATLTGNCTFTLSNPIATGSSSFTLVLTNDGTAGRTVAWSGGSFVFPGGAASLSRTTTANAVDVWVFFTPNGGTTWYGNIAMKNMTA